MKKIIYLSMMIISFFSCGKKQNDLKLELLTSQIICVQNINKESIRQLSQELNEKYDSVSKNVLHYKITNTSDNKYFLMLNENNVQTIEKDLYSEALGRKKTALNKIGFSMYKGNFLLDGTSTKSENMCGNVNDYEYMKIKKLDTIINNFLVKNRINKEYKIINIEEERDSIRGYYLQPGETKYFTSIITLPFRKQQQWISNIDSRKPDLGSLSLQNDSIFTRKRITKNQKKEIKENGYLLFNGIIYSNKVPVKLISI